MSGVISYIPVAIPGGGIISLTGDDANPVVADGAGNVNVTGGPNIVVDRIAANNLRISTTATVANFRADDGNDAQPDINNRVFIYGDANIETDAGTANTIAFSLADDITITDSITAGGLIDCGSIECAGNITSLQDIDGRIITASIQLNSDSAVLMPDNPNDVALIAGGNVHLRKNGNLDEGVVQLVSLDPTTLSMRSNKGTDGQLLIGSTADRVEWANILSADGSITVTNGSHSIDLAVNGAPNLQFQTDDGQTASPQPRLIRVSGAANQIVTSRPANNEIRIGIANNPTLTGNATMGSFEAVGACSIIGTLTVVGPPDVIGGIEASRVNCTYFNIAGASVTDTGVLIKNAISNRVETLSPTVQGQILIGRPGARPVWNTLTAGAGINIDTTTPDNITITATGGGGGGGTTFLFHTYLAADDRAFLGYTPATADRNYLHNFTVAYDPFATINAVQCSFTAPATAYYEFNLNVSIARSTGTAWTNTLIQNGFLVSYRGSDGTILNYTVFGSNYSETAGITNYGTPARVSLSHSPIIHINAGTTYRVVIGSSVLTHVFGLIKDITTFSGYKLT
jgi:hypothetical protein